MLTIVMHGKKQEADLGQFTEANPMTEAKAMYLLIRKKVRQQATEFLKTDMQNP